MVKEDDDIKRDEETQLYPIDPLNQIIENVPMCLLVSRCCGRELVFFGWHLRSTTEVLCLSLEDC